MTADNDSEDRELPRGFFKMGTITRASDPEGRRRALESLARSKREREAREEAREEGDQDAADTVE